MEYIKWAAVKLNNNVFVGRDHGECDDKLRSAREIGFVTSENRFVSRSEALEIAIDAGQVLSGVGGEMELNSDMIRGDGRFGI